MEDTLGQCLERAFKEVSAKAQGEVCLTCANFDPGATGGCFLHETPKADVPATRLDAGMLFAPVKDVEGLSSSMLRAVACPAYNDTVGYPDGHPRHGGWLCSKCGKYLPVTVADSREIKLPMEFMQCPCGANTMFGEGFYAV